MTEWVPRSCTLPSAERPVRVAEFEAVFADACGAERVSPRHLRVWLAGGPDLEASVRDLTARESRCCAFFTFALATPQPGRIRLDIEVPPAHTDVLDGLAARLPGPA